MEKNVIPKPERCFKCGGVPVFVPTNAAHTAWACVCDCGASAHDERNRLGALWNWNTLQGLEKWNAMQGAA